MKKNIIYSICLSLFFVACSGDAGNSDSGNLENDVQDEFLSEEMGDEEMEADAFIIPSALQIGTVFQRSGLGYIEGVVTNPADMSKYVSKNAKLLNFGVYSADLAYCILNGQSQQALNFLKAVKDLADGIGYGGIFSEQNLYSRFEKNIDVRDSVLNLLVEIQEKTDVFVEENNMQEQTYVIFAGAWVEGMYLGVNAFNKKNKEDISRRLVEQMNIMTNLIRALKSSERDVSDLDYLLTALKEFESFYNKLESIRDENGVVNVREANIADEDIEKMSEMVKSLRNKIITVS
jgi:hypothetical protein